MNKRSIRVVYATKTGHSRKIASTIGKELNSKSEDIKSDPELNDVDLLIIVGGIYGGQSLPELINFAETLDNSKVKKVALVTSCMSKNTPQTTVRSVLQGKEIEVIEEEFICQGSFLFFGLRHPNKEDIANAVIYAKKVIG